MNRRAILALGVAIPLLRGKDAVAITEAEKLAEPSRIQEIFDVQKAANSNLPLLKDSLQLAKVTKSTKYSGVDKSAFATGDCWTLCG